MNYKCPKRINCVYIRCAKHILTDKPYNKPVSSPCKWYIKHLKRLEIKEKLNKISKICTM